MLKVVLAHGDDGVPLHIIKHNGFDVLATSTLAHAHGVFKSVSRTTAGTTVVTTPSNTGSIVLTDLIISTDKTNASSVTVRFSDGVNTSVVSVADSTNAPVNIAISFMGNWQGWRNAWIEVITTGTVTATVALGYYKLKHSLTYADWDSLR